MTFDGNFGSFKRLASKLACVLLIASSSRAASTFSYSDQWSTGGQGVFRASNDTGATVTSWTLEFDWGANITSVWNGVIQSKVGDHYVLANTSWNGALAVGAVAEIGCVFNTSEPGVPPTNLVFRSGDATASQCASDINGDGVVDSADVSLLLLSWGDESDYDFDASGMTDSGDMSILLLSFGPCEAPDTDPVGYEKMPTVEQRKIVGYYPNWGIYQKNFPVTKVRGDRVNVINYAFLIPLDRTMPSAWNRVVSEYRGWTYSNYAAYLQQPAGATLSAGVGLFDEWADARADSASEALTMSPAYKANSNFAQLQALKAANSKLRTMISIGGWTLSTPFFSIARDAQKRADFAKSAVYVVARYGFDGIDVDWEYPGGGGLEQAGIGDAATDGDNYLLLLQALRDELNKQTLIDGKKYYLSIAGPAGDGNIANMDPKKIAAIVDWINVMAYDFHGGWDPMTGFNAPMVNVDPTPSAAKWSVSGATDAYLTGLNGKGGVPTEQIVLGVPFYGRGWNNVEAGPNGNGLGQSGTPGTSPGLGDSEFTYNSLFSNGVLAYSNGVFSGAGGFTRHWNAQAQVPYLYSASAKKFITYDDTQSMAVKMEFANQLGLGGTMFWELSEDTESATGTSLMDAVFAGMRLP